MEKITNKIVSFFISAAFSAIEGIVGTYLLKEFPENIWLGLGFWILAFVNLYFSYYIIEIREHKDAIENLKKEIKETKERRELDEKVLNTLRDIITLEHIKKLNQ